MLKICSFASDESIKRITQMAERKKRTYRKKKTGSDDESQTTPDPSLRSESQTSTPQNEEDVRYVFNHRIEIPNTQLTV